MRAVSLATVLALGFASVAAVTSPMPYRPGYGLGAWIPSNVVQSMRREAERRVEIMTLDSAEAEARSAEREISMVVTGDMDNETKAVADDLLKDIRQQRVDMMTKKVAAVKSWLTDLTSQTKQTKSNDGSFTTFGSEYESAVDWAASTTGSPDRAFDSINIGVHYVRKASTTEDGTGSAHAEKVARELNNQTHSVSGRVTEVHREAARMAAQKTAHTEAHHDVVGTLIVSAFATHRAVKQFTTLKTDVDKLWRSWNFQLKDDRIPDPLNQHDEFNKAMKVERDRDVNKERNSVAMVSELYMGSVIVGLVHFVQKESTTTKNMQNATAKSRKFSDDVTQNVRNAQKAASEVGSTSIAIEEARKMAKLGSSSGLDVQFDLVSIGYIPKLTTDPVQQAVSKFANFDPAQFQVPAPLLEAPTITGLAAVQSNMASVIDATVTAINKQNEDQRDVLTDKSLMDAFTDFADTAKAGGAIGAPIGINVAEFNKLEVMSGLANKYLNTGIDLGVDV